MIVMSENVRYTGIAVDYHSESSICRQLKYYKIFKHIKIQYGKVTSRKALKSELHDLSNLSNLSIPTSPD